MKRSQLGNVVTTLDAALEDWKRKLPSSMSHFFAEPTASQQKNASHQFPFLWFMYPQSGTYIVTGDCIALSANKTSHCLSGLPRLEDLAKPTSTTSTS